MSVKEFVYQTVAESFKTDESKLSDDTNFLEDLKASSINYFPIINALEEEYDLDLQYQQFRSDCKTIGDVVAMVESEL